MSIPADGYPKGLRSRERLLESAWALFLRDDRIDHSLRVIAKEAGLSLAGLSHHFPTRDELLVELQRLLDQRFAGKALDDTEVPLAKALAEAMANTPERRLRTRLHLTLVLAACDPDHPAAEYLQGRYDRLCRRLADDLAHRRPSLGDSLFAAKALVAAADGVQVQWLLDPSIDMSSQLERTAVELGAL